MSEEIIFPDGQRVEWSEDRRSLLFAANHGNESIICVLAFETIMDLYHNDPDYDVLKQEATARAAYARHMHEIHEASRRLIEQGKARDGELVILSC